MRLGAALRLAWRVGRALCAVAAAWYLISFARYVHHDNGDTTTEKVATWGRNNHLGGVIDWLEAQMYSDPPSKAPASRLAMSASAIPAIGAAPPPAATSGAPTTVPAPTVVPTVAVTPPPTADASIATESTVVPEASVVPETTVVPETIEAATTTPAPPPEPTPPVPITPVFSPALTGEGEWVPIAKAAGHDAMWATSIRPYSPAGGVVATMVEVDQTYLRAGMFNGSEQPGGTWKRGNRVPDALWPALLAAFNGGFRFEHFKGGYVTEGQVVKPLRDGDATLAIDVAGELHLGVLGRDIFDDGSWASLRQNLILIVDGGQSQVKAGVRQGVWWGADYGDQVYVPRSAVCTMPDGRLAYALVGQVDAEQLAQSLIAMGCVTAIQLDINGTWPVFFTFGPDGNGNPVGHPVDRRMGGNPYRYITGSSKEFFAFFDSSLVPAASILDP